MSDWVYRWMSPEWLLDRLGLTLDQLVAGSNAIPQVGSALAILLVVTAMIRVRGKFNPSTLVQAAGVVVVSISWLVHRGYWNLSIFHRYDGGAYATWAEDLRLIPASQMLLLMVGTVMLLSRFGHIYLGPPLWWALVVTAYPAWVGYSMYLAT